MGFPAASTNSACAQKLHFLRRPLNAAELMQAALWQYLHNHVVGVWDRVERNRELPRI